MDINEAMLEKGMDFETAHREIVGRKAGPAQLKAYSRSEIITENRINFDKVLADKLYPYQRIVDMMTAEYEDGKPNWKVVIEGVKLYHQLYGNDPRMGLNVNIDAGGNVNIAIGDVYNLTKFVSNDEDRIALYNEIRQGERRNMYNVTPGRALANANGDSYGEVSE